MKTHVAPLLVLLSLATVFTTACGDSSAPQFTQIAFFSDRVVSPATQIFTAKPDGTVVTPVPSTATSIYYPSISRDAKTIAFFSQNDAWVQKADGTGVLNLTTTTTSNSEINFVGLSPDGKRVLFSENNDEHLHIINVDGSGDLDLTPTLPAGMNDCYSGSFNASSTLIVFVCQGATNYGLYTVKPDGTGTKTVTATRTDWTDLPFFTPDGKKIIFVGQTASVLDVESIGLDGSGDVVLVSNTYESMVINSSLYYTFHDSGLGLNQIYKAKLDGTGAVSISDGLHNDSLSLAQ